MISLIAATAVESNTIKAAMTGTTETKCGRFPLFKGRIRGHLVSLLVSGVGKVNAALATEALLSLRHPKTVILFGCAGAYPRSGLKVGDLAIATEEIFGDEGVQTPDGFLDMEQLGLSLATYQNEPLFNKIPLITPMINEVRAMLKPVLIAKGQSLITGPFVTVSCGSGTDPLAADIVARTDGICENMEGAAVAQVCLQHKVSMIELRGISNMTGDRNQGAWDIPKATAIVQEAICELFAEWDKVLKSL
jgi:futalosine hydrolase